MATEHASGLAAAIASMRVAVDATRDATAAFESNPRQAWAVTPAREQEMWAGRALLDALDGVEGRLETLDAIVAAARDLGEDDRPSLGYELFEALRAALDEEVPGRAAIGEHGGTGRRC